MSGRTPLAALGRTLSAAGQARAQAKARAMGQAMDLGELRRAKVLSQRQIAQSLRIGQASVSKLEKRTDMYISTLRSYIEAMGGELDITARFPDHSVRITDFSTIGTMPAGEDGGSDSDRERRDEALAALVEMDADLL